MILWLFFTSSARLHLTSSDRSISQIYHIKLYEWKSVLGRLLSDWFIIFPLFEERTIEWKCVSDNNDISKGKKEIRLFDRYTIRETNFTIFDRMSIIINDRKFDVIDMTNIDIIIKKMKENYEHENYKLWTKNINWVWVRCHLVRHGRTIIGRFHWLVPTVFCKYLQRYIQKSSISVQ